MEIKFRLWLNHPEEMITDFSFFVNNGKIIADTGKEYTDIEVDNDVTLMQFTGLKDKNGIEIYEGDIVKRTDEIATIFFNSSMASFDFEMLGGDCESMVLADGWHPEAHEIIGNIYQNPDLLK